MLGLSVCSPGDSAGLDSYMYYVCLLVCPNERTTGGTLCWLCTCTHDTCRMLYKRTVFVADNCTKCYRPAGRVLSKLDIRLIYKLEILTLEYSQFMVVGPKVKENGIPVKTLSRK